jgi:site-specific DNA recombinase
MRQIAIGARVSSDRQREEQTIDSQIEALEIWAKENDCIIVERYFDDGWSGDILARPELDRLRDDADKKVWGAVVFTDMDRLARRYSYQQLVIEELQEKGVDVIFLHQAKAETPEDKVLQGFQGLFAEYERVKIAERMRRGKLHKARNGNIVNGPAPYGYDYIPKTKNKEGHYAINEKEAAVVRKIFHWIADEGTTLRGVIRRLNEDKIYPRKQKRAVWSNGPISRLVRNEAYIGNAYYNKNYAVVPDNPKLNGRYKRIKKSSRRLRPKSEWLPIQIQAILDKELFNRVQQQLALNKRFNPRNVRRSYLLTGIAHCVCGRRRIGESVKEHIYYRCTDRIYNFPLPQECKASGVDAEQLDTKVWVQVFELLTNPQRIREQAERWMNKESKSKAGVKEDLGSLQSSLRKLQDEEKRYVRAYGSGLLTINQFQEQIRELRERKEETEEQVNEAGQRQIETTFDLAKIKELPAKVVGVLKLADFEEKRNVLRNILETVIVGDSNKVYVKGYIPVQNQPRKVGLIAESRNCRVAKCRKKYSF